jgi:hypothetical protein
MPATAHTSILSVKNAQGGPELEASVKNVTGYPSWTGQALARQDNHHHICRLNPSSEENDAPNRG